MSDDNSPPPSFQPPRKRHASPSPNPSSQRARAASRQTPTTPAAQSSIPTKHAPHAAKKASRPPPVLDAKARIAKITRAPEPARRAFDPWNSAATGHQRADNRLAGSTDWRASRSAKLSHQFEDGVTGGEGRVADTVGAGSENFGRDGRKSNGGWVRGASGLRAGGQKAIWEFMGGVRKGVEKEKEVQKDGGEKGVDVGTALFEDKRTEVASDIKGPETAAENQPNDNNLPDPNMVTATSGAHLPSVANKKNSLFQNVCVYINGSTMPLIGDQKLKQLLVQHGARISLGLGRRSVTHVVLGTTSAEGWCGGGLAASKIEKEVARTRGCAVKFVSAEWVVDSINVGRRQPESRYEVLKLARQRQQSVRDVFKPVEG